MSAAPKHTPGPWTPSRRSPNPKNPAQFTGFRLSGPKSAWIADIMGEHVGVPAEQCKANAALIAAAPEMLKALNMVRASLEGAAAPNHETYGLLEVYEAICTVLAAAEGECKS